MGYLKKISRRRYRQKIVAKNFWLKLKIKKGKRHFSKVLRAQMLDRFISACLKRGLKEKFQLGLFKALLRYGRKRYVRPFYSFRRLLMYAAPSVRVQTTAFIRRDEMIRTYSLAPAKARQRQALGMRFARETFFDKTIKQNFSQKLYSKLVEINRKPTKKTLSRWTFSAQAKYFSVLADNFRYRRYPWLQKFKNYNA